MGGIALPSYRNRPAWGADESLRLRDDGTVDYPVAFYPVQKITVHHTASWTPWSEDESVELLQAVYAEHIAQEFGDIGYHLLIDPRGTVYEGRYSGGTSFPIYNNYPSAPQWAPQAVNAAHTYQYNAGNIGISMMGDYDSHDISDEAWWALKTTIALICANTGLDPLGESRYHNPINGVEAVLPNIVAHRTVAGTDCPGRYLMQWFDLLREEVAALVPVLGTDAWLA
ncbi:MAG: peptidoglycan recognition family protein [Acidimicrobiales bacterium]